MLKFTVPSHPWYWMNTLSRTFQAASKFEVRVNKMTPFAASPPIASSLLEVSPSSTLLSNLRLLESHNRVSS